MQEHVLSAEGVLPVRHPAAAERVGNEAAPARKEPKRHAHGARVDVLAVADQLRDDVFAFAARADGAGLAVVDARHGVIQVRQMGRTRVKDRAGFFVGAVAVRDGDRTELGRFFGKFHRTGQLCRHIRDAKKTLGSVIKPFECSKIRLSQVRAVLRALFLFGEERPLHVEAHQAGAVGRLFFLSRTAVLYAVSSTSYGSVMDAGAKLVTPFCAR